MRSSAPIATPARDAPVRVPGAVSSEFANNFRPTGMAVAARPEGSWWESVAGDREFQDRPHLAFRRGTRGPQAWSLA